MENKDSKAAHKKEEAQIEEHSKNKKAGGE